MITLSNYPIEYYEFFVYFNEGDYYTCHDLLEEMWLTEKDNLFLKGLLQMSVALYHYGYGNVKGARLMMKAAKTYLANYPNQYWGIDLELVRNFVKDCLIIIPHDIERIRFEDCASLPILPDLILYLNEKS